MQKVTSSEITNLIVHEVSRLNDGDILFEYYREAQNELSELNESDNGGIRLTTKLVNLFKSTSLNVGEFALDKDPDKKPSFELELEQFNSLQNDFVKFTTNLAILYKTHIDKPSLKRVKGGLLVFYTYTAKNKDWLAIAVIDRIDGINTSTNLDLNVTQIINLDRLHLGAAVNLTDWESQTSSRYIRFKAGTAKEIRDYFEAFIGCERDKAAAERETDELKHAIKKYAESQNYDQDRKIQVLAQAHDYIKDCQKHEREIKLSAIANHIFPEDLNDTNEDGKTNCFIKFANENYNLSEELTIHTGKLRSFKRISGTSKKMNLSFERELIGREINISNEKLIIDLEIVPTDAVAEIKEEIKLQTSTE